MNNAIKNKIIATIAVIVVLCHIILCGSLMQIPKEMYWAINYQLEHNIDTSFRGKINSVVKGIRNYSIKNQTLHENNVNIWIDIWGYVQKRLGKIYFPGVDTDMVLHDGHLIFIGLKAANIDKTPSTVTAKVYCQKHKEAYQYLCDNNIEFLHIVFPRHMHQKTTLPLGLKYSLNQITSDRVKELNENGIPVIDARELFKDSPETHYQLFYKGDHHWKPEYAYRVYIYISQELEKRRSPMVKFFNRNNMAWNDYYIEERLPPFHDYLGSGMRRVGRLYLPERDITPYMIPRNETNYTFQVPSKDINKTGAINDTFLYFWNDVPIEKVINNQVNNKNKIMIFHDSFIHSFAPFLATNNYCLYMIDLRHYHGNIIDLIEREKPDAIFFAYEYWAPFSLFEQFEQEIQEKQKLNNATKND